jgi:hypothetical protein
MDKADWLLSQTSLPRSMTEDKVPNPVLKNAALRCFTSVRQLRARTEASWALLRECAAGKKRV